MPNPVLHYVYDPLCGWCYAATPIVDAAAVAGIPLSLHGGGLWGAPTKLAREKLAYIRQSDARIAALTGQRFGDAYLNGLLGDTATVFWSQPTIAAVLAAGEVEPGAQRRMLHAIQEAHYVAGLRVVEPDVLTAVAAGIGLDEHAFAAAFAAAAAADHIERTRGFMARSGLRGFPGFVLENGPELVRVPHEDFYGHPDAFVQQLAVLSRSLSPNEELIA
ncbi:DsbA family protein [uncultured Sphingomonas sp.]|uniref:DsbA family protein n=1 Tax=uncultured Sphingomonas sp. TaxID=158754 RepID=UPI0035CB889A